MALSLEMRLLLNEVWLLGAAQKISTRERQTLVERKGVLIRMPAIWGDGELSVPQNHLWRFCLAMKVLKGRSEVISVKIGGQSRHHPSLCTGSWTSCDLPLDVVLFTQFGHTVCSRDY